jgi:nucleotide-binding universal stress UspA family protein
MTTPIVVGVHESLFSGQALHWAADQARLEGRPLLLAHAGPASDEPLMLRAAEVVRATAPDLDLRRVLRDSSATTMLAELSTDAEMVVLGSRGRGPASSHLLGSVGQRVVQRATCPVVVHRPGTVLVRDGVVAAVEAGAAALPVLDLAFRVASLRALPLRVLHHVWDPRSVMVGAAVVGDLAQEQEHDEVAVAEALAGFGERYPDVRTTVVVTPGVPERDIAVAARTADLLVVGTHHPDALTRLLVGSVSVAALERATCPVAVVPLGSAPW